MQRAISTFRPAVNRLGIYLNCSNRAWFWGAVFWPFVITRAAWVLAAAYARGSYQPNPTYLQYALRGGIHTRIFLLDIFAHWDAGFYLSIIRDGYWAQNNLAEQYSNAAFFPLYPYLVKSVGWLGVRVPGGGYIAIGVLLSNACFLAAAVLLYRLAVSHLGFSDGAARRSLALLMVFPASFFFSSFYTESLFLFLTLAGFTAALERRWWLAGLCGALVTLTRAQGILVAAALAYLYVDACEWRLRAIRADALWLALAPAALAAHILSLYRITGVFLAPVLAQTAWGRSRGGLLEAFQAQLAGPALDVFKIDALLALGFLACGVWMLRRYPKIYGLYTILMVLLPLSTGSLTSMSRLLAVIFPVFLLLGDVLDRREGYDLLRALWFTLQVIYFAGWANYYWIA